jgi:ABC-type polysaccharide/polyol phosphate transport system ATPase subunit
MSTAAISVRNIGKWFNTARRSDGFREASAGALKRIGRREPTKGFWALRDVSFDIHRGEVMGLIGPNGAGKSVLLKILAGVTSPTEGRAEIRGRIGTLLELGTGFHGELSGRDNIFFNGAFLGMRHAEIAERLDEIIDFAGIRYAIHEPLKHYSSGMTMRLAFSIAVNLTPEVILLDEVWAVGDIEFQKRSLAKIRELVSSGRTVVIVSHSLDMIADITTSCLLLERGRVFDFGKPGMIIRRYVEMVNRVPAENAEQSVPAGDSRPGGGVAAAAEPVAAPKPRLGTGTWRWRDRAQAPGSDRIRLVRVRLLDAAGQPARRFEVGTSVAVEMVYNQPDPRQKIIFGFALRDLDGAPRMGGCSQPRAAWNTPAPALAAARRRVRFEIPGTLAGGSYRLVLTAGGPDTFGKCPDLLLEDLIGFEIVGRRQDDRLPPDMAGAVPVEIPWTTEELDEHDTADASAGQRTRFGT